MADPTSLLPVTNVPGQEEGESALEGNYEDICFQSFKGEAAERYLEWKPMKNHKYATIWIGDDAIPDYKLKKEGRAKVAANVEVTVMDMEVRFT